MNHSLYSIVDIGREVDRQTDRHVCVYVCAPSIPLPIMWTLLFFFQSCGMYNNL